MGLQVNEYLFLEFSITTEKRLEWYILRAYTLNLSNFKTF